MANTKKSNTIKSSIKKSSNTESYTASKPPPGPFFDLPYDIRATIYEHIDALPPFSTGIEYAGFILCCSQTKEEMYDLAAGQYNKFVKEFKRIFEEDTGHVVTVSSKEDVKHEISAVGRSLTITLPYAVFSPPPGNELLAQVLSKLHPLMALYLDKLRIHFLPPTDSGLPRRPSFNPLFNAEMRANMRDIAVIIEKSNTAPQTSHGTPDSK
jgi:hypothetical protein